MSTISRISFGAPPPRPTAAQIVNTADEIASLARILQNANEDDLMKVANNALKRNTPSEIMTFIYDRILDAKAMAKKATQKAPQS